MQKKSPKIWSIQKKAVLLHAFSPRNANKARPGGGIGRRVGLKHQWETVPVRSRPWVLVRSGLRRLRYYVTYVVAALLPLR